MAVACIPPELIRNRGVVPMQKKLSRNQLAVFYQYHGDESQVEHFLKLVPPTLLGRQNVVVDIGGGNAYFALQLQEIIDAKVRILDSDEWPVPSSMDTKLS